MGSNHSRDSSYLPVANHDATLDLGGGTSSGGAPDAAAADAASNLRPRRLEAFRGKSVRTIRSLATIGGLIDYAGRSLHTVSDWPMQGLGGGRGGVSTTTDGDAEANAAAANAVAYARSTEDGVGGIDGMEVVGSAMTLLEGRLVIMIYSFLAPEDLLLRCPAVARRWFVLSANDSLWTVGT